MMSLQEYEEKGGCQGCDILKALEQMKQEYKDQGYYCDLLFNRLTVYTNDGHLDIFWKDGAFYEENYYNS